MATSGRPKQARRRIIVDKSRRASRKGRSSRPARAGQLSSILDSKPLVFYARQVIETRKTPEFAQWLRGLRGMVARGRIAKRITLLEGGHFGDVKSVGDKVSELRIDHGPGYRLYFT